MSRIRFHIGAHKTATTHLQLTLARSRLAPGTRYVPLKRLRMTLISPVRKRRPRLPWHRWFRGTWLFSDENILGTTEQALKLYPNPANALRYFADSGLSIFLCVRRYDSFLASAYGERLWRHPFRPFDPVVPARRWPDVARDLREALPGTPLFVWRYEDYGEHAKAVAQFYAGGAIEEFGPRLDEQPKTGFSARAVAELARFHSVRPTKSEVLALRHRFPVGEEFPRFDPWTPAQRSALEAMYEQDLHTLGAMVQLWRPTDATNS